MGRASRTSFELRVGSLAGDELEVRAFSGRERISGLYLYDVRFTPRSAEPLALEDLVGGDALLTLRREDGSERHVHGIASAIDMAGVAARGPLYRVRIAPKLSRLAHVRRSRVFQALSAPDIVAQVLREAEVEHRMEVSSGRPSRDMCLQYGETDLAFLSRLLEEEGIHFFFEHGPEGHVLVLADGPEAWADIPGEPSLPYRPATGSGDQEEQEHLTAIARRRRLVPSKVTLRDFDFLRPGLDLTAEAGESDGPEVYEYPGDYLDVGRGRDLATIRLEEMQGVGDVFTGEGNGMRLAAGLAFEVTEHPEAGFDRRLVVVDIRSEGRQVEPSGAEAPVESVFRCRFDAMDAGLALRPRRRTPTPRARAETATIVGPGGEEIHPDEHGRVKIRFHWDKDASGDDTSSAWVRLSQQWAGAGFGASFVPRVGQEVLVRFLEHDPDRPIVVGAIYNGEHPPPLSLPAGKTQSTLRTSSSPGDGGANEIRFEDAAGEERISLHAQKDERIEVQNDETQRVGANEGLDVAGDRSVAVNGEQRLRVAHDDAASVEGSSTLLVTGGRRTYAGGSHVEDVAAQDSVTVGGKRIVSVVTASMDNVGAAAALTVGGAYAITVGGVHNKAVGGAHAVQVGGARTEYVAGSRDETVGKSSVQRVGGEVTIEVDGAVEIVIEKDDMAQIDGEAGTETPKQMAALAKAFDWKADAFKVVVNGKVALEVKKSGAITLAGKSITWEGSKITTKGAKVKKLSGAGPSSGSATVRELDSTEPDRASVDIALEDQHGRAFANEPFKVEFPDGTVKEGTLDGSGRAKVAGPKPGNVKVSFPRLDQKTWKDE